MNWVSEYANNIADSIFYPAIILTIIAAVIGGISLFQRDFKFRPDFGSPEYGNTTWRMHTAIQGVVILWIVWGVLNAVPAPDYIYRTKVVEKIVEGKVPEAKKYQAAYTTCMEVQGRDWDNAAHKNICDQRALVMSRPGSVLKVKVPVKVSYASSYAIAYDTCLARRSRSNQSTQRDMNFCDIRAIVLSKPNGVLRIPGKKVLKKIYLVDPYLKLYNTCMHHHKVLESSNNSLNTNIENRMGRCHEQAMQVREDL